MSNKKSFIGLLVAIGIFLFAMLYYKLFLETKREFLLDNPTDKKVNVILNGTNYVLAPGQTIPITINMGENTITSFFQPHTPILTDTTFIIKTDDNRGVINPTLSTYYIFRRYYGHIKNKDSLYKAHHIFINGKKYIGEIKERDDLLIQDFYFNINQSFPKIINKVDSIEYRVKLFRKNEFLDFYQANFE